MYKNKEGPEHIKRISLSFAPGTLKAVSRKDGKIILTKEIHTAGKPAKIQLTADRQLLTANGNDLSFITVKITDANGNLVPDAANDIQFNITGPATIAGVDNGSETSMESFKANHRKAFNGLCLLVVKTKEQKGHITVTATSNGLATAAISLQVK